MPKRATPDGPGERVALLSRTTIELRQKLEQAAAQSGRSLGQEVERRLERSFDFDYLMGDNETALVLRSIANAVQRFEKASGKSWVRDSETQERVHEAVSKMVDVLMAVRPEIDDRIKHTGPGLPVDFNDLEQRVGFRTMALDQAIIGLQTYRREKEQELIPLVREGRARRELKRETSKVRAILNQATREELAQIAGALFNSESNTGVRVARTQSGIVVAEQGADGKFHQISSKWHSEDPPHWSDDTEQELRTRVEMMLNLPPSPDLDARP